MFAMLYAVLICTDDACAEEFEAWGDIADFEQLACEGCGCMLHVIAYADPARIAHLPRRAAPVQLRNAA